MTIAPRLIVQVPRGSAVDRQLQGKQLRGDVAIEAGPTDEQGHLDPPPAGQEVLSVPSPEALRSEADEVRRVIAHAGFGVEPLVIVVEAAEELRDEEVTAVLEAAGHTDRAVILRVIRGDV